MTDDELDRSVAVQARGLGKQYRLGQLSNIGQTVQRLMGRHGAAPRRQFSALDDINFTVQRGESIGVVGTNGSGKSTLLQLLAGTVMPSHGELILRGRVLPLLAVGLGFHPELTGRENVTLFGASLGIPAVTVTEQMDAILDFAGVTDHADTPTKRYSSGMVSRLSVAIAVRFPADIYIFDEVLAVVDQEFQERCLTEIRTLHARGATVFFVSHNQDQVHSVSDRVIWLDHGRLRDFGPADEVLEEYRAASHAELVER